MISTKYLENVRRAYKIKQKDLADEWARLSEKGKHQSSYSRTIKLPDCDSLSLAVAISNLSGLSINDIIDEKIPEGSKIYDFVQNNKSDEVKALEDKLASMEVLMSRLKEELNTFKKG